MLDKSILIWYNINIESWETNHDRYYLNNIAICNMYSVSNIDGLLLHLDKKNKE